MICAHFDSSGRCFVCQLGALSTTVITDCTLVAADTDSHYSVLHKLTVATQKLALVGTVSRATDHCLLLLITDCILVAAGVDSRYCAGQRG